MTKIARQKRSWSSKMVVRWRHCSLCIYRPRPWRPKVHSSFFNLDEFTKKIHKKLEQRQIDYRSIDISLHTYTISWWRGTVVERRSLAGELSLSCARPAADG